MKRRTCTAAAILSALAGATLLTVGGPEADARPPARWHVSITQITRWCGVGATVYFQLERLEDGSWDEPRGVRTARVQRRAGTGWKDLGSAVTAATGSAGSFYTSDLAAALVRVQAPDGTWSFPYLGGDLCTRPTR